MSIYTAPSTSFIDTFMHAAKYRDQRTDASNKQMLEGVGNLVKGSADAYKWQQRKNILDKKDEMQKRIDELLAERERLASGQDYAGSSRNFDAIINGLDWNLLPHQYVNDNLKGVF